MARRFKSKRELGTMADINVTPLLDLAFALLIIFLISTPLLEQPVEVQLPTTQQALEMVKELPDDVVELSIDAEGTYYFGRDPMELEVLGQVMQTVERDRIILVRGDENVRYSSVARLIDLLRGLGFKAVSVNYAQ